MPPSTTKRASPRARRRPGALARLAAAALLAALAGSAGATATTDGSTGYIKLHPDFLVNLESADGASHFLHATIEVRSDDPEILQRTWHHVAAIRHELLLYLSEQRWEEIHTPDTRARLQREALEIVNRVLMRETGSIRVDGLYFTHYLVE